MNEKLIWEFAMEHNIGMADVESFAIDLLTSHRLSLKEEIGLLTKPCIGGNNKESGTMECCPNCAWNCCLKEVIKMLK